MSTIPGIYINGRPVTVEQYVAGDYLRALLGQGKPTKDRTPGPHLVNFFALDTSIDLTVLMGDGPATLSGGNGGWQEESRRGLAPVTWWDSPSAYRQSIPVMFTGNGSQEGSINALQRLAASPGGRRPPPAIAIAGPAIHRADLTWVIEGIEAGSNVIRRAGDGQVLRQDYTVNLLQYNAAEVIVERSPSRQASSKSGTKVAAGRTRTTYRVQEGDTLPKIAAHSDIYGDATLWKRIANANGIRDPRALTVGRLLKIPR